MWKRNSVLPDVRIYKSLDGGLTWALLDADDYGRGINEERLFYEFNRDGLYKAVVTDNFRSGIDAVVYGTAYAKPAPKGTLYGVTDGGCDDSRCALCGRTRRLRALRAAAGFRITFRGRRSRRKAGAFWSFGTATDFTAHTILP